MKKTIRIIPVLLLAAGVAACAAPASWQKPSADAAEQRGDLSRCRAEANTTVEDRYGSSLTTSYGAGDSDPTRGVGGAFHEKMTRHDAGRTFNGLVADCMRRKGYTRSSR